MITRSGLAIPAPPNLLTPEGGLVQRRRRHIVSLRWRGGIASLCQIQFHKNGSLFVHFPYQPEAPGLLARAEMQDHGPERLPSGLFRVHSPRVTITDEIGSVTAHRVKYSHPPDGRAHFSQDGKLLTRIRNDSAPLDVSGSVDLFSVDLQGIKQFSHLSRRSLKDPRVGKITFSHPDDRPPASVHLVGRWLQHEPDMKPVEQMENPLQLVLPKGRTVIAMGIAPPPDNPFSERVLAISAETQDPISSDPPSDFLLIFMGAFSRIDHPGDLPPFLMLQYPAQVSTFPSIDFAPAGQE